MAWEEISDILTPEGALRLKVGQVLMFDYEGSRTELKVMRKVKGKVWCRRINTVLPDEVQEAAVHLEGKEGELPTPKELGQFIKGSSDD